MTDIQPSLARNEQVAALQRAMNAAVTSGNTQDAVPQMKLEHAFARGVYARQLWRPKGTLIVGKIHKFDCLNFVMSGRLRIWSEAGVRDCSAPDFWASPGGQRRVTFALEDSLLITVHGTSETDLDKLESELTIPDCSEVLEQLTGGMK